MHMFSQLDIFIVMCMYMYWVEKIHDLFLAMYLRVIVESLKLTVNPILYRLVQ